MVDADKYFDNFFDVSLKSVYEKNRFPIDRE